MQNPLPSQGFRLASFLGISIAASLLTTSVHRVQAQASVSLDVNGKRSLQPASNWITVQTVRTGFEAELGLSGEAAIYRVVK